MKLLFFNLYTTFFRILEWVRVCFYFYTKQVRLIVLDCLLASQYISKSPHRISKAFLKKRGALNLYTFGETPLTTLNQIALECRILSKDTVYELGCGSGRTCFWLRLFVKCQVVGIDFVPAFIQKANRVKGWLGLTGLEFLAEDMLLVNLQRASFIYLYGTCLEENEIEQVLLHFKTLHPKTKVISVSYPLTDYAEAGQFRVIKQFKGRFPWGLADIYLNEKQ